MELLDIYNENREKTGRVQERGTVINKGDYSLVIHLWIINDKGEILIQKRQATKTIYPNMWDASVAGAVIHGEDSLEAVIRETKEELGIDLDTDKPKLIFSINRSWWIDDIWITKENIDIKDLKLQYEEVSDAKWVSYQEMIEMMEEGKFIKYDYIEKLGGSF